MVSWFLVHFSGPCHPLQVQVGTKGTEETKALRPLLLRGPLLVPLIVLAPVFPPHCPLHPPSPVTVSLAHLMAPCSPALPLPALFPLLIKHYQRNHLKWPWSSRPPRNHCAQRMPQISRMLTQGEITRGLGLERLVSQRTVCKDNKEAAVVTTGLKFQPPLGLASPRHVTSTLTTPPPVDVTVILPFLIAPVLPRSLAVWVSSKCLLPLMLKCLFIFELTCPGFT